jgi:hypothetical protein
MTARTLVVVLALPRVAGFAYTEPRARWTLPYDALSQEGLSRKLRFAVDPAFCEQVRPWFVESMRMSWAGGSTLCRCEEIQETLVRGFKAWAFNNKHIDFYNVSWECSAEEIAAESCAAAEIFISASAPRAEAERDEAAVTTLETSTNTSDGEPPRDTSDGGEGGGGKLIAGDRAINKANIRFILGDDACYYLDDSFCRALTSCDFDVKSLVLGVHVVCHVLGIGMLAWRVFRFGRSWKRKGKETAHKLLLKFLSRQWLTWVIGILIIFPNVTYFGLLVPCLDCVSFEALAVHQVGIALGLAPLTDETATWGVAILPEGGTVDTTCGNAHLKPGVMGWSEACSGDGPWTCSERDFSVMLRPSPYHNRACLSQDDLDALNALYPSCKGANTQPICIRSERNHVWINFVCMGCVPLVAVALLAFAGLLLARRRQQQRMKKASLMQHCLVLFGDKAKAIFDRTDELKKAQKEAKRQRAVSLVNNLQLPELHRIRFDRRASATSEADPARVAANRRRSSVFASVFNGLSRRASAISRRASAMSRRASTMLSPRGAADDVRMPEVSPQEVPSSPRGAAVAPPPLSMAVIEESSLTAAEKAAYIKMDERLRAKAAIMDDDSNRVTGARDSAIPGLDHPTFEGIDADRLGLHIVRARVVIADDHEDSIRYSENMEYHGLDYPYGLGNIDETPRPQTPEIHPALVSMDEKLRLRRAAKAAALAARLSSGDKGSTSSDRPVSPVDRPRSPVAPPQGQRGHKVSLFHRYGGEI